MEKKLVVVRYFVGAEIISIIQRVIGWTRTGMVNDRHTFSFAYQRYVAGLIHNHIGGCWKVQNIRRHWLQRILHAEQKKSEQNY